MQVKVGSAYVLHKDGVMHHPYVLHKDGASHHPYDVSFDVLHKDGVMTKLK